MKQKYENGQKGRSVKRKLTFGDDLSDDDLLKEKSTKGLRESFEESSEEEALLPANITLDWKSQPMKKWLKEKEKEIFPLHQQLYDFSKIPKESEAIARRIECLKDNFPSFTFRTKNSRMDYKIKSSKNLVDLYFTWIKLIFKIEKDLEKIDSVWPKLNGIEKELDELIKYCASIDPVFDIASLIKMCVENGVEEILEKALEIKVDLKKLLNQQGKKEVIQSSIEEDIKKCLLFYEKNVTNPTLYFSEKLTELKNNPELFSWVMGKITTLEQASQQEQEIVSSLSK